MSAETLSYLSSVAHVDDIAVVWAMLCGSETVFEQNRVKAPSIVITQPEMSYYQKKIYSSVVQLSCTNVLGEEFHTNIHLDVAEKHLERDQLGQKLYITRATPLNIAVGQRLIEIFGGVQYFTESELEKKSPSIIIDEGEFKIDYLYNWEQKQDFIKTILPVKTELIRHFNSIASYPYEDNLTEKLSNNNQIHLYFLKQKLNNELSTQHIHTETHKI